MKHSVLSLLFAFYILFGFSSTASGQPFLFVDATTRSTGIGGGTSFGRGVVQPGIFVDIYHANELNEFAPDMEAFATLGWSMTPRWYLLGSIGGGAVLRDSSVTWSLRSFFFLVSDGDVGFRVSLYALWTPEDGSVFLQPRVGPNIRLGRTGHSIFPNLGVTLNIPASGEPPTARFIPGCTLIFHL